MSEVSGTATTGTDEQESHKRLFVEVEAAHHVKGRNEPSTGSRCGCGISGKRVLLPGEVSVIRY